MIDWVLISGAVTCLLMGYRSILLGDAVNVRPLGWFGLGALLCFVGAFLHLP